MTTPGRGYIGAPPAKDPITGKTKKPKPLDPAFESKPKPDEDWGIPTLIGVCPRCDGSGFEENQETCEVCVGSGEDKSAVYQLLRSGRLGK